MFKRIMLVLSVVTLLSTNASGIAFAAQGNSNKNHPAYWETTGIQCQKFDNHRGQTFTATQDDVVKVVVKGGPDRTVYTAAPFSDLTAPVNPNNKHGKTYGISHVIVCNGEEVESNSNQPTEQTDQDNYSTDVKPQQNQSDNRSDNSDKPNVNSARNSSDNSHTPVTICHRTRSLKNPYVMITVDDDAADGLVGHGSHKADHYGVHTGPVFSSDTDYAPNAKNWGDIIPPVDGAHNGLNWNEEGRAIYDNDCQVTTDQEPDDEGEVLGDDTTNEDGEILDAASTNREVASAQAPTRIANTGLNSLLAFLLPALAAVPAYPLLRNNKEN